MAQVHRADGAAGQLRSSLHRAAAALRFEGDTAEQLFYRFNNEHPADYRHPSMSVSDIVAIKRDGKVSCHYCDSFGFARFPASCRTTR